MKVVFIGAGNLATCLSLEMLRCGFDILQVYSRTEESASILARKLGCQWTKSAKKILPDADVYVFSVKDDALPKVIKAMKPNNGLWIHTSGSTPIDVFKGFAENYGVLYPLQTFSKMREMDFSQIPIFIEANSISSAKQLEQIAAALSENVRFLPSAKRKYLHLAAVFACNFTNHVYSIAERILDEHEMPVDVLLPLIDETAYKVHQMPPIVAQTGPAIRYDKKIINYQLSLLEDSDLKTIYKTMSKSIHKEAEKLNQDEQHQL